MYFGWVEERGTKPHFSPVGSRRRAPAQAGTLHFPDDLLRLHPLRFAHAA